MHTTTDPYAAVLLSRPKAIELSRDERRYLRRLQRIRVLASTPRGSAFFWIAAESWLLEIAAMRSMLGAPGTIVSFYAESEEGDVWTDHP